MKVSILGCGGSGGVPLVGGIWGRCDPTDPRNRRRRPSILVEDGRTTILIDTSPDLRAQLLDSRSHRVDAVLFTHAHADHCHGIDDLRPLAYTRGTPIPAYTDAETLTTLNQRFGYAFDSAQSSGALYSALLTGHTITPGTWFTIGDIPCAAFEQTHGSITTLGFRVGPIGYSPDADGISETGFELLDGVSLWIVDCLRFEPHPSHAHFARTINWVERVSPKRAVFTHMNHMLDYAELARQCPVGVEPGVDGMELHVSY